MEMKFTALERELPGSSVERIHPLLGDEARRVWELKQSGARREIYFQAEQHTTVRMLECALAVEARQLLGTLLLVKAGLIDFDLIPPVCWPGGWSTN